MTQCHWVKIKERLFRYFFTFHMTFERREEKEKSRCVVGMESILWTCLVLHGTHVLVNHILMGFYARSLSLSRSLTKIIFFLKFSTSFMNGFFYELYMLKNSNKFTMSGQSKRPCCTFITLSHSQTTSIRYVHFVSW